MQRRARRFYQHPNGGYVRLDISSMRPSHQGPVFQGDWLREGERYPERFAFYPQEWQYWTQVAIRELPSRVHFFFTYDTPEKYQRYLVMQNRTKRRWKKAQRRDE